MDEHLTEEIRVALNRSFHLGQIYWQQADSDFVSQQNRSDSTKAEFHALVDETISAIALHLG